MAKYIVLGKFTDKGRQEVKGVPERRQRGREAVKELGVTFEAYVTMGRYDLVWVADAPDDESVAKWIMTLGSAGFVTTQTMRAFTESEVDALTASVSIPPR
jgi:uncharacterized protein with GYD domain